MFSQATWRAGDVVESVRRERMPVSGRAASPVGSASASAVTAAESPSRLDWPSKRPSSDHSADKAPKRLRHTPVMTEVMVCGLCEQQTNFEFVEADDELVCTSCGAVIDAMSDESHRPLKLPLQLHVYTQQDFVGSIVAILRFLCILTHEYYTCTYVCPIFMYHIRT